MVWAGVCIIIRINKCPGMSLVLATVVESRGDCQAE